MHRVSMLPSASLLACCLLQLLLHQSASVAGKICNPDYETGAPVGLCGDGTEVDASGCCGQGECSVRLAYCHCVSGLWCRHAWHVILFNERHYDGRSGKWMVQKGTGACHNLPIGFNDSISSINTHGNCARLYDLPDCVGSGVDVQPGSTCHRNLDDCSLDDRVSSLRSC